MLPLLARASPDCAVLVLTLGAALIALELNRPGWILPGSLGLLLALLAAASLALHHPSATAALSAVAFLALLVFPAWRKRLSWPFAVSATIGLILAIAELLPAVPGPRISAWAAVTSGLVLGAGTTVLTGIARRACQNKGLD